MPFPLRESDSRNESREVGTMKSKLEKYFEILLRSELGEGIPEAEREWKFHPTRKWAFDFAWPAEGEVARITLQGEVVQVGVALQVAVEIEGGTWSGNSRHTRGKGFEGDCDKYNEAVLLGWKVLRFTGKMLEERGAECINKLRSALELA